MSWLVGLALVIAAVDWWAVAQRKRSVEYFAKPAVMVALLFAAATTDVAPSSIRTWFVVALLFSLAGDVFLMLARERFVAGLASFLIAHLAYTAGLLAAGVDAPALLVGVGIAAVAVGSVGRRIGRSVQRHQRALTAPVWAYIIAISTMLATAVGTANTPAITGAALFYGSDAVLGWTRFVAPIRYGRLAVIVPYHIGQTLLVVALRTL